MQLFILVCIVLGVLSNTANTLPTTTTTTASTSSSSSATTTEKSHHHDDEPELRTTTNASNSAEGDEESEDEEEEDDDDIEEAPEVAPAHAAAAADGASSGMSSNPQLEQQVRAFGDSAADAILGLFQLRFARDTASVIPKEPQVMVEDKPVAVTGFKKRHPLTSAPQTTTEQSEDEEEEDDDDIEEAPEVAPAHAAAAAADGASSGMSSNPQLEQQVRAFGDSAADAILGLFQLRFARDTASVIPKEPQVMVEDKPVAKIQDSKQHGGPHASLLHHLIMKRATEEGQDDLMGSAQTIRGYAPNVAPYANSNTRFADYHRSRPNTRPLGGGGGGGGGGGDFKPYATAFSPQTAQRLSSLRVNTSSKRFGFRDHPAPYFKSTPVNFGKLTEAPWLNKKPEGINDSLKSSLMNNVTQELINDTVSSELTGISVEVLEERTVKKERDRQLNDYIEDELLMPVVKEEVDDSVWKTLDYFTRNGKEKEKERDRQLNDYIEDELLMPVVKEEVDDSVWKTLDYFTRNGKEKEGDKLPEVSSATLVAIEAYARGDPPPSKLRSMYWDTLVPHIRRTRQGAGLGQNMALLRLQKS
ncbi:unnamed protein product [Notodromas monacha]|uniref:Uncharacterized protein n=1 Tax=Notodromas monacha TaxID=399045 RepID=A0A7R9BJ33_9CRUS|nr:unnamed protein product [Notodromas monacha]CAG0914877.1 unnamed protein product [Notodromas monacha]